MEGDKAAWRFCACDCACDCANSFLVTASASALWDVGGKGVRIIRTDSTRKKEGRRIRKKIA